VIIHQVSMHRNITPLRVTRLSRVSSRASGGFTTIVQRNSSPARSFPLLTRIRWINRRPDQPNGCLQTGKRCFTNRGGSFGCGQFRSKTIQMFLARLLCFCSWFQATKTLSNRRVTDAE
jgi:hypothetical protein